MSKLHFAVAVALALVGSAEAKVRIPVTPSPLPEGDFLSRDFTATVAGENCDVRAGYLSFETDGAVELKVKSLRPFKSAVVRPRSFGVKPKVAADEIRIWLPGAGWYLLELDDGRSLAIFANRWNGFEDDIRVAKHNYGPGVHDIGFKTLAKGDTVYIDRDAVVYGGFRLTNGVDEVRIVGYGVVDGSRLPRGGDRYDPERPRSLSARVAKNLRVRGPIFRNSPGLAVFGGGSCLFENVKVLGRPGEAVDGLDVVNAPLATVRDSFFRVSGDAIALKGLKDYPKASVYSVAVSHSVLACEKGRAFGIGPETWVQSIRDVLVDDCDVISVGSAALAIDNGGPGSVQSVTVNDIRVELRAGQSAADLLTINNRRLSPLPTPEWNFKYEGWMTVQDVSVRGVKVLAEATAAVPRVSVLSVTNTVKFGNITLSNFSLNGKKAHPLETFACETNAPAVRRLRAR